MPLESYQISVEVCKRIDWIAQLVRAHGCYYMTWFSINALPAGQVIDACIIFLF